MAEIEFIEETHQYLADGVLLPSVSKIIAWYFGDKYKDVPKDVLKMASEYGTGVHNAIDEFIKTGVISSEYTEQVIEFCEVEKENNIEVTDSEQTVHFEDKYAGRYDLKGIVNGIPSLIDIKTTYDVDKEHLALQLALYRRAIGEELKCYCLWLPKRKKGQLIEIEPYSNDKLDSILNAYMSQLESPYLAKQNSQVCLYSQDEIARIRNFMALKNEIDRIIEHGKTKAKKYMRENGIKSVDNGDYKITYTPPTKKTSVDIEKMKQDGIYEKYTKETDMAESVRITWRNQE